MPRTLVRSIALLLFAMPAALACNGDSELSGEGGVFLEMLRLVPDTEEARAGVLINDVAATRDILGIERLNFGPDDAFDEAAHDRYIQSFLDEAPEGFRGGYPLFLALVRGEVPGLAGQVYETLGLTIGDVDQWVGFGNSTVREVLVFRGDFDPGEVADRLGACAECPPSDFEEDRGDWHIYGWGEDFSQERGVEFAPPLFDQLGRGGRLAVKDGFAALAFYTEGLHGVAGADAGTASLGDAEDFRLAALAMDEAGALAALITDQTPDTGYAAEMVTNPIGPDHRRFTDAWTVKDDDTLLRPYTVLAYGPGWDEDGAYTALALVHVSEEDAAENRDRFEDRLNSARLAFEARIGIGSPGGEETWAEVFTGVEAIVYGRVLAVKLHGRALSDPGFGGPHIFLFEPMLLHE